MRLLDTEVLNTQDPRYRRLWLTGASSTLAKAVSVLAMLITVPAVLSHLGSDRYGLWIAVTSFVGLLSFADLGLGNGLVNAISEANGRDDRVLARQYVSTAFFVLLIASFLAMILAVLAAVTIPWSSVLNVQDPGLVAEAVPAVLLVLASIAVQLPLGVAAKVQQGYQEGFRTDLWTTGGSITGLIGTLIAVHFEAGIPVLVLVVVGVPVLTSAANLIELVGFRRPWLWPRWQDVRRETCAGLFRLGFLFLVMQLVVVIAYTSDSIVVTRLFGPAAVTEFSIPSRVFASAGLLISMFLTPLWSAYGEAIARGDAVWIRKTFSRSVWFALWASASAAVALLFAGPALIAWWVGPEIRPAFALMLAFALWTVVSTVGNAVGMLLNGAGAVRLQVVIVSIMAIAAIVSKIALGRIFGLPGVAWGTVLAYVVFSGIPQALFVPGILRRIAVDRSRPDSRPIAQREGYLIS